MPEEQNLLPCRPESLKQLRMKPGFLRRVPQWAYSWLVFWSEQWSFLKVLDAAGKFVIVVALGCSRAWPAGGLCRGSDTPDEIASGSKSSTRAGRARQAALLILVSSKWAEVSHAKR